MASSISLDDPTIFFLNTSAFNLEVAISERELWLPSEHVRVAQVLFGVQPPLVSLWVGPGALVTVLLSCDYITVLIKWLNFISGLG